MGVTTTISDGSTVFGGHNLSCHIPSTRATATAGGLGNNRGVASGVASTRPSRTKVEARGLVVTVSSIVLSFDGFTCIYSTDSVL